MIPLKKILGYLQRKDTKQEESKQKTPTQENYKLYYSFIFILNMKYVQ